MKAVRILLLLLLISCSAEEKEEAPVIEADKPEAAILEYPIRNSKCTEGENTAGNNTEIAFLWEPGKFTTSFKLVIVNLLTEAEQSFTTAENFYPVTLERGTPYSWYVIAFNAGTPEGTKSNPGKFYTTGDGITNYAPFAADLLAPANNAEFAAGVDRVKLEWQAEDVDGEELEFELYLSKNRDLSEAVRKSLSADFYETAVEKEVTYYWKVVAKDPAGNTSESNVSSFTILGGEDVDTTVKSSEKKIFSFSIEHNGVIYDGEIDHEARTVFLELDNFDYRKLNPIIKIPETAKVVPASGVSQNFLDDLYYSVIAEDGTQVKYDIIVLSGQNDILDFEVHHEGNRYIGIVDAENATVTIDLGGRDFSAMETYIKTSNRSTIDPPGGAVQNFNRDLYFTVTSEKGTTKAFKVIAPIRLKNVFPFYSGGGYEFTTEALNERFILYAGADLNFAAINFPDPENVILELIGADGTAYPLQIKEYNFYYDLYLEISNPTYQFNTIIPYSVPTGTYTYRIRDGIKQASFPHKIEIINEETSIRIESLNKDELGYEDTLIVSGKNLTNTFFIFSDFSYYKFGDYGYYNSPTLSEDKTKLTMKIDQNIYGNLSGGNMVKPIVFYNMVEGYDYPVLSNTAYFTLKGGW